MFLDDVTKSQCSLICKVFKNLFNKNHETGLKLKVIKWKIQMADNQVKKVVLY